MLIRGQRSSDRDRGLRASRHGLQLTATLAESELAVSQAPQHWQSSSGINRNSELLHAPSFAVVFANECPFFARGDADVKWSGVQSRFELFGHAPYESVVILLRIEVGWIDGDAVVLENLARCSFRELNRKWCVGYGEC